MNTPDPAADPTKPGAPARGGGVVAGDLPAVLDLHRLTWLLEVAHVATVPGTPFGGPGYLRFSYACSEQEIDDGIAAIRGCLEAARR